MRNTLGTSKQNQSITAIVSEMPQSIYMLCHMKAIHCKEQLTVKVFLIYKDI